MDLQFTVERHGGVVTGFAAACPQALEMLASSDVDAAILDYNLEDRDSVPVAEALRARKIPFVFCTGGGVDEQVRERWPDAPVLHKPCLPVTILKALQEVI